MTPTNKIDSFSVLKPSSLKIDIKEKENIKKIAITNHIIKQKQNLISSSKNVAIIRVHINEIIKEIHQKVQDKEIHQANKHSKLDNYIKGIINNGDMNQNISTEKIVHELVYCIFWLSGNPVTNSNFPFFYSKAPNEFIKSVLNEQALANPHHELYKIEKIVREATCDYKVVGSSTLFGEKLEPSISEPELRRRNIHQHSANEFIAEPTISPQSSNSEMYKHGAV